MTGAGQPAALPPRRRDEESEWHDLEPFDCPMCGCTNFRAQDDPEIVWEPGRAWDEECRARDCRCHTEAVEGARRT